METDKHRGPTRPPVAIGHGYDVHRLSSNRRLVLGGVPIEHELGLVGHSDADVVLHAVMDAILGASGLGDIGRHFSNTDERWKDASSVHLLDKVAVMVREHGWRVGNVDVTVIAEQPKLAPHIPAMRQTMANRLGIDGALVNVKATTAEGLGPEGRQESISAHAVALLIRDHD